MKRYCSDCKNYIGDLECTKYGIVKSPSKCKYFERPNIYLDQCIECKYHNPNSTNCELGYNQYHYNDKCNRLKASLEQSHSKKSKQQEIKAELYSVKAEPTLILLIPRGKENAITRNDLSAKMNVSDRKLRAMIHELRGQGHLIIALSSGKGYYRPESREDVEEFIKEQNSYIKSIQENIKNAKKELENYPNQVAFL